MSLVSTLAALGLSQRDVARAASLSQPAMRRLVSQGEWPAKGARLVRSRMEQYLRQHGATAAQLLTLFSAPATPAKKLV